MKKFGSFLFVVAVLLMPFSTLAVESDASTLIPNATSGILIEANSGKIIYEKEKDKQVAVASMTKMVAQIIILEQIEQGKIHWDDVITVSKNAADMGGSQIYLSEGEKISIEDLMKGISMASGNDATVAMAEVISGTEAKFVELMNQKVKDLGLKNTHFKNCTGLDEEGHYSSAYDMAMIARELVMNHPDILKFSSVYEDYLREDTENKFWLVNTNKLVRFYEGADGLKTGHTDAAGYCLAATAVKNDLRLIAIVLGESDSKVRNSETMDFLDYGFSNIKMSLLKKKGQVVQELDLEKAEPSKIQIVLQNNLGVVEDLQNDTHKYRYDIQLDKIVLPLKPGDVVGKILVKEDNKIVSSGTLVVDEEVSPLGYLQLFYRGIKDLVNGEI